MSTGDASWISSFFSSSMYTITVTDDGSTGVYDSSLTYSTDAVYTVKLTTEGENLPLALLYSMFQIALSDIAAYKAEAYMEKIEKSQDIQSSASVAIADAEGLQEAMPATVAEYVENTAGCVLVDTTVDTIVYFDISGITDAITANYSDNSFSSAFVTKSIVTKLVDELGEDAVYAIADARDLVYTLDEQDNSTYHCSIVLTCLSSEGLLTDYTVTFDVGYSSQGGADSGSSTGATYVPTEDFYITSVGSSTSIYSATLTDDIVDACILAGIDEVDGVKIYTTDESTGVSTSTGASLTSDQLDTLIEELELAQENASSTTQTDMVYAEEYLGQYNSYLTGSSSTLDDFNSSILSIAGRIG